MVGWPCFCSPCFYGSGCLQPGLATAIVVKKAATGVAGEVRVEGAAAWGWQLKKHNNGDNGNWK